MQNFYLLRNNLLCCNTLVKYMNTGNIVKWFKWIFFFRFCGNVAPPTINTNSSTVWVTFHSDGSIAGTGFAAQYRAVLPAQSQYSVFQISVFQTGGLGPRRATQKAGGKMWRKKVKWKNYILNHSFYLFIYFINVICFSIIIERQGWKKLPLLSQRGPHSSSWLAATQMYKVAFLKVAYRKSEMEKFTIRKGVKVTIFFSSCCEGQCGKKPQQWKLNTISRRGWGLLEKEKISEFWLFSQNSYFWCQEISQKMTIIVWHQNSRKIIC